jgi:formylglycine-generating enzyme required for sulfatase activity
MGVGKKRQGGLGDAVNVVNALVPEAAQEVAELTETHWLAATLAGSALLDLGLAEQTDGRPHHRALVRRVQRWLVQLLEEGRLPPRERLEAGDVLGRLGDPRPGVGCFPLLTGEGLGVKVPDILWVHIPAGPFLMGSTDDDAEAYDVETPQHELSLPGYYIARYPITNAQFRPFVEGDGYTNRAYWTEQGWAWRQGAEPDLSVWDDYGDEDYKRRYREWLAARPVEKRDCPFWWDDPRWAAPTRPVVGITWFEALAYTRWLRRVLAESGQALRVWRAGRCQAVDVEVEDVRLPSEAEWEKAARGVHGAMYPWGEGWEEDGGNTEEAELVQTSPVGLFPQGASPWGVLEMAGNVWEWTRSRWGERSVVQAEYGYPYDPHDGRERVEGTKIPIVRGGSWAGGQRHARCAYRHRRNPDLFYHRLGFRVVVSLVFSGC